MSSIPEDQQSIIAAVNNKRSFFFRKDSIQKLKCTAMYPFQVAGIKLNRNAIIELLETNIMKARICTQKAILNFYIVILRLLSSLFTLYNSMKDLKINGSTQNITQEENNTKISNKKEILRKIRLQRQKRVEIVDDDDDAIDLSVSFENNTLSSLKKRSQPDTYQSRLLAKLERIQKHKTRLNGKSLRLQLSSSTETEPETHEPISNDLTNIEDTSTASRLKDKNDFLLKGIEESTREKSTFAKYCLILCVHIGLLVMYLQALVLCFLLNSTKIPFGLLFLLTTISIIGYILFKVSFFHKFNGKPGNSSTNKKCNPLENSSDRQTRSIKRKAPMLDIYSKTLSKVKLL